MKLGSEMTRLIKMRQNVEGIGSISKQMRLRNRKGTEMIEFAFVMPIFFLLVLGGVDIGWFMYQRAILNYAAREGAQVTARTEDLGTCDTPDVPPQAADRINAILDNFLPGAQVDPTISISFDCGFPDDTRFFTLEARWAYEPLFGSLVPGLSSIPRITSKMTMYYEALNN